jgi:hypothetical protein
MGLIQLVSRLSFLRRSIVPVQDITAHRYQVPGTVQQVGYGTHSVVRRQHNLKYTWNEMEKPVNFQPSLSLKTFDDRLSAHNDPFVSPFLR